MAAKNLTEEMIGAAASGQGRSQFAPDQTVANDQHSRNDPRNQGLRSVHGCNEQRDRDKRPNPDHVGNIQRNRLRQPETSHQLCVCWLTIT